YPQRPSRANHAANHHPEYERSSTKRNAGPILGRVVDCPKPELLEHARLPQNQTSKSERKNCADAEDRNTQGDRLKVGTATNIIEKDNCGAEQSEKPCWLFH